MLNRKAGPKPSQGGENERARVRTHRGRTVKRLESDDWRMHSIPQLEERIALLTEEIDDAERRAEESSALAEESSVERRRLMERRQYLRARAAGDQIWPILKAIEQLREEIVTREQRG